MRHYGVEMGWHRTIGAIAANAGERRLVDQTGVESAFSIGLPAESRVVARNPPAGIDRHNGVTEDARLGGIVAARLNTIRPEG